jgi:hypothetical protein
MTLSRKVVPGCDYLITPLFKAPLLSRAPISGAHLGTQLGVDVVTSSYRIFFGCDSGKAKWRLKRLAAGDK